MSEKSEEKIEMPCLYCGKIWEFPLDSYEGRGGFYVFCDGDCEDQYAAKAYNTPAGEGEEG